MGPIGVQEMIAIFVIALVLFGPKKLPELGRMLGRALSEFRRAKNELKSTFETHLQELERETRLPELNSSTTPDYSHSRYSYPYEEYDHYDSDNSSSETEYEPNGAVAPQLTAPATHAGQESEAQVDQAGPEHALVADTVPRTNGVKPVEPVPISDKQEHPV